MSVSAEQALTGGRRIIRPRLGAAAVLLTIAVAAATACASLASRFWLADLLVHFRLQYAAGALLGGIVLMCVRRKAWAAVAFLVCILNLALAAPRMDWVLTPSLVASADTPDSAVAGVPVRVAAVNVHFRSRKYDRVIEFIRREQPDAAVLVEVNGPWHAALKVLAHEYPYSHYTGERDARGVLLLSRWPIEEVESPPIERDVEPPVLATLRVRDRDLRILGVHASWPLGPAPSVRRNRQLAALARVVRSQPAPLVVVGDLNISPFSPHFQSLLVEGGLRSAAGGFGWQPTWPTFMPFGGIQIDHGLISSGIEVRDFRRGADVGSDHLPIVLDLAL